MSRLLWPWYVIGALLLGVLLAMWSWVLLAPQSAIVDVTPRREISTEAGQLFGTVSSGTAAAQIEVLADVHLVGVFASTAGKPGFAVLKVGDKSQVGVPLGESMPSGEKLVEIHPDYVLLEKAGLRQRVNLAGRVPGGETGKLDQK